MAERELAQITGRKYHVDARAYVEFVPQMDPIAKFLLSVREPGEVYGSIEAQHQKVKQLKCICEHGQTMVSTENLYFPDLLRCEIQVSSRFCVRTDEQFEQRKTGLV